MANEKPIKQSVLNTFKRVGINHERFDNTTKSETVDNRFGGGSCQTTPLIRHLIAWVYNTSNAFEMSDFRVSIADFDRIRYFVLEQDSNAYMTCLD